MSRVGELSRDKAAYQMSGESEMITPVIMAGGSGTRLCPLSRAGHPKQFLALNGEKTSPLIVTLGLGRRLVFIFVLNFF